MDDEHKELAKKVFGRDQAMAMVRDNQAVIDCYRRFFPDPVVRTLAEIVLCEYQIYGDADIELKKKEDGTRREQSGSGDIVPRDS